MKEFKIKINWRDVTANTIFGVILLVVAVDIDCFKLEHDETAISTERIFTWACI